MIRSLTTKRRLGFVMTTSKQLNVLLQPAWSRANAEVKGGGEGVGEVGVGMVQKMIAAPLELAPHRANKATSLVLRAVVAVAVAEALAMDPGGGSARTRDRRTLAQTDQKEVTCLVRLCRTRRQI